MKPTEERQAILETKVEHLTVEVTTLANDVKTLTLSMTKYKGMWGGISLVFGAIVTVLTLLYKKWGG